MSAGHARTAARGEWCLTHDRRVTNRFVAAVCPNEPNCKVRSLPTNALDNGSTGESS